MCRGNGWKRNKNGTCNAHIPPGKASRKLPGTSRTAGFFKVGFSLPISLPGNFPDCGNLRETVSRQFLLPVSLPGNFPDLPALRPFAFPPKKYNNGSGFWCQGDTNNKPEGLCHYKQGGLKRFIHIYIYIYIYIYTRFAANRGRYITIKSEASQLSFTEHSRFGSTGPCSAVNSNQKCISQNHILDRSDAPEHFFVNILRSSYAPNQTGQQFPIETSYAWAWQ